MEFVYSISRKQNNVFPFPNERLHQAGPLFSISSRNAVVFSSFTELNDSTGSSYKCHVYVSDLNMPWKAFKVMSHTEEVCCLEWDISGNNLLICDVIGNVQIWSMKDYLLNSWKLINVSSFPGEHFISAAWFHCGKKITLNSEKKDSSLYMEKFTYLKFSPTLKHFGGRPKNGCVMISSSGMLCVIVLSPDSPVITGCESLGTFRHRLKVADLCYAKNGDFLVVASDGLITFPIHCYQIAIKVINDKCHISCQSLPSFYLNCFTSTGGGETQCSKVSHVKFVVKEAADAVVVASSGPNGSQVELWELKEKPIIFHKLLYAQNMEQNIKTVNWQHNTTVSSTSPVVAMSTPCSSIYDSNPPPSFVIVSYKDGSIKCYFRESLRAVGSMNVSFSSKSNYDNGERKSGIVISDMHLTHSGSVLIAIDSLSQMYVYRLSPVIDPGGPVSPNYVVTLLEYCLITGIDWWDVLLGLKLSLMELIFERLSQTFNLQPLGFQANCQNKFLALKSSLYRCLSNGQNIVGDCHALLMLNAISTTFKSLLRPIDLVHHDKDPAENLAATLSGKSGETDIDKVLVHLENKEFIVEPQVLQSLQQLIQWVAQYTLFLLSSIPQQHQHMFQFPGGGLLNDKKALITLQELLLIIRMWGLIKPSCLPVFTRTTGPLDVLSLMFKLISKALLSCGSEPDETLMDECFLLTNQVQIYNLDLAVNAIGVASPSLSKNSFPLNFEYHSEPDFLDQRNRSFIPDGVVYCDQKVDVVRHMYLGKNPGNTKMCTRCNSISLSKVAQRAPATRAWDQRWIKSCPCGGQWIQNESC